MSQTDGLEDAAILMMSLGEAEASEVFKHLSPKEVQKLGEAIANAIFWAGPLVGLCVFVGMGIFVGLAARRLAAHG